jgi:TolA-binding protein
MDAETMALLTGLLGTVLATLLIGGAMVGAWLMGRRRGERDAGGGNLDDANRRLARLEEMIERMSGEVERLSESEQFTMRLLKQQDKERVGEQAQGGGKQ